ncbi:hypothetical protein ACFC4C_08340 [Streptomyces sp. NPDC056039]|uniref:hypothetical protein n=1 Tax=Streptomyces TaxID=1883 RepID=UPI0035E1460B
MNKASAPGNVHLFVPSDWFDLLEDGNDTEATRRRCAELVRQSYPAVAPERQTHFVDALMAWYKHLLASGTLLYGIVSGPMPDNPDVVANWQVMAGVVDVPETSDELDIGSLLSTAYGTQADEPSYQESFTTDMGVGFGFVTQSTIRTPPDDDDDQMMSAEIGVVGALTCEPGGGKGILFIGVSLDPRFVGELAGLLAVMAGRSTFSTPAELREVHDPASSQESAQ